jgi:hypothetical protein
MTQENRSRATNAEPAKDVSAGSVKSVPIVSQPRPSAPRFDSRRTLARRRIVRELDEWFGIFHYPDPNVIYAVAPSREAALDG